MTDGTGIFGEVVAHTSADGTGRDRAEEMRAEIRARLHIEIQSEPYFEPNDVASLLKIKPKTLANDRASTKPRWPRPIRMAGGSKILYARSQVIEWLVEQEVASAAVKVHRCL